MLRCAAAQICSPQPMIPEKKEKKEKEEKEKKGVGARTKGLQRKCFCSIWKVLKVTSLKQMSSSNFGQRKYH